MIEISVVVPVFNAAGTLESCLGGLLGQDLGRERYQVIVVDNNSTDASAEIARRYPVVLLAEPRPGAYAARNRALAAASGALVAFTDPDCVPRPDWLRRLTEAMADPHAMVVMGRDRPAGRSLAVRLLGEYDHYREVLVMASSDPRVYYGHTNNLVTRRHLFEELGHFEARARGSDTIFVQRVLARSGPDAVKYHPEALVDHLEISSAWVYFRKAFIYGGSGRRYSRVVATRALSNRERVEVYLATVRANRLPLTKASLLFTLLVVGVGFYYFGWLLAPPWRTRDQATSSPIAGEAQP